MIEEMIDGMYLQVVDLNLTQKVKIFVFMATEELIKINPRWH